MADQRLALLATRLVVRNSSSEPMVLKAKDISLRVEGSELRMKDLTTALRNQTIQAGLKTVELSKLKVLADLKIPRARAGQSGSFLRASRPACRSPRWCCVSARRQAARGRRERRGAPGHETAGRTHRAAGMPRPVDDFRRAQHGERGEPLQRLGIAGAQKVVRVVIRFTESATPLEGSVLSWLHQGLNPSAATRSTNQQMPVFPPALRELHLAALPNSSALNLDGSSGPSREFTPPMPGRSGPL